MTLTIEISPEVEAELSRAAQSAGRELPDFIVEAARAAARDESDEAQVEAKRRREAAFAGLGMFANNGRTVDDFLADRHAEGEAEYDKWVEGQNRAKNAAGDAT